MRVSQELKGQITLKSLKATVEELSRLGVPETAVIDLTRRTKKTGGGWTMSATYEVKA